jgi:hypothetical protein
VSFQAPVLATGAIPAFILPIERPALAAMGDRTGVAWLEMTETHSTRIWYARSLDGGLSFEPGQPVTTQAGEVTMVQLALDNTGSPALAWLQGESLHFARSYNGGASFEIVKRIGERACDCCQPRITLAGDQVFIAYRGLETDPQGDIRDAAFLHSADGGKTFGPVVRVSDAHWYLPACPIAGPALAVRDGRIHVAWMDSRGTPPGEPFQGRIWSAASSDGGDSFSANIQVSPEDGFHHTLPALAVGPQGRIHIAWEARLEETDAILYAYSQDGGQSFSDPFVIADNRERERGSPRMPSLVTNETGRVYLAWIGRLGARVAAWDTQP